MKGFAFLVLIFSLAGCATYQSKVHSARRDLANGNFSAAAEKFKVFAFESSKDQLIYLMDYGLATHLSGAYEESNRAFLQAADLAEFQDYHSVSKIGASLVLSEEMVQYKGEAYENLLIQVYLAKNFILLGNFENALVSIRKIHEIMEKYRMDEKKFEGQNVLAHYFSGIMWESEKDYDSAAIEYDKAYNLAPSHPLLQMDTMRANLLAGRDKRYKELRKKHPDVDESELKGVDGGSELIIFFSQGWAPRKRPHPDSPRLPYLSPISSVVKSARARVEGVGDFESLQIYSVEDTAMNTLAKDYDALVAKRLAAIVAKAVVSDQIRQKNKLLGDISWIVMNVADRADVRQWSTLPETFQLIRIPLEPGEYNVTLEGLTLSGVPIAEKQNKILLEKNQKKFLVWRTFQ